MKALKFIINGEEQEIPWCECNPLNIVSISVTSFTTDTATATINSEWWYADTITNGSYVRGDFAIPIWENTVDYIVIGWTRYEVIWDTLWDATTDNQFIWRVINDKILILNNYYPPYL